MSAGQREIIILGAGGHAKVILSLVQLLGFTVPYILDDGPMRVGSSIRGIPIRGPLASLPDRSDLWAFIAIGDNRMRMNTAAAFRKVNWATLIHPFSWVDPTAKVGAGTCILAGVVVNADATMGNHAIVNSCASVGHECVVSDFCQVGPGVRLGGAACLAEGAFCAINSVVLPDRQIGAWATLGAGAVAVKDVPSEELWLGVPAKPRQTSLEPGL